MDKKRSVRHILFWVKSSRGTDEKAIFEIPHNWTDENIKRALEKWCSRFGAWDKGENKLFFDWEFIEVLKRKELNKAYDLACEEKEKAAKKWQILAAMFNIKKLK
ncbi:MAG: hypothetical protein HYY55_03170 [Candidatus Niyogibacteria bacterium]|nr:MAG: hypothetical protein HYY55_03170 [Candidatus Niyogibacteria bacterium]